MTSCVKITNTGKLEEDSDATKLLKGGALVHVIFGVNSFRPSSVDLAGFTIDHLNPIAISPV